MNQQRKEITNNQWVRIKDLFPSETGRVGRPAKDNRIMVNGILWILRTGAPWRDLPKCYGPWQSIYTRFSRWTKQGIWDKAFKHIATNSDDNISMIDSTAVKAHQHAAGAKGGSNFRL
jgi:transposase